MSFLAPYYSLANCIQATANKIVDLNNYMSLVYCVVPSSFHDPQYESGFARTS